jgi:hypothetical protein
MINLLIFILIGLGIFGAAILFFSILYFKFGFGKGLYHDIMGWHMPKEDEANTFDGYSIHNHCKFCGEEIIQDSQGNWF